MSKYKDKETQRAEKYMRVHEKPQHAPHARSQGQAFSVLLLVCQSIVTKRSFMWAFTEGGLESMQIRMPEM